MINENSKLHYLEQMGITVFERRIKKESIEPIKIVSNDDTAFDILAHQIRHCEKCALCKTRTNVVVGDGSYQAKLMIIGEAPGANEDKQGKPFVGRAGMLLTQMLRAIHLKREEIYICNILKCRPPENRDPLPEEVECCTPFLKQQIDMIQPKLIVTVGRIAAHFLLNTKTALGSLRGTVYQYNDTPLLATYHPAYLLRNPKDKSKAYEDMLKISEFLASR